ncbi:MAG TPA: copper ion binding protein [Methylomusa anaerophila]|uniref:Copper chaperone CopZ n=1 Tax=Methylomusa anaerophila TaxID=1930071 RepID=A0A348AGR3_9FIRM|nr:copper ion binding protein [Methylomusa anaerophila]BBB90261.1 copper chaperone CopZ [Methylomusa anaerophila]HML89393.1 copper ion binding protein [Methylomusa anaerophila]
MEKIVIPVEGMSCGHCKNAVEKAVRALPGVTQAEVDLAAKTLTAEFDSNRTSLTKIKAAIEEEGYTPLP